MAMYEYVTSPGNGTMHVVKGTALRGGRTLCGRLLTKKWLIGDETQTGLAATCERCRSSVRTRTNA